jgi:hypothetical protein
MPHKLSITPSALLPFVASSHAFQIIADGVILPPVHFYRSFAMKRPTTSCLRVFVPSSLLLLLFTASALAEPLPLIKKVSAQPLATQVGQLIQALDFVGSPLSSDQVAALNAALNEKDGPTLVERVQQILDPLCLVAVNINPESRVKVEPGPATPELVEVGWRQFLVKVANEAGVTAELKVASPQASQIYETKYPEPKNKITDAQIRDRWCELKLFDGRPMKKALSGLELEYRIIQIYSRDAGKRAAVLSFNVGQGTQDVGFRSETQVLFTALPATKVTLGVIDDDGKPTTAAFTFRDKQGRVYPSQAKRLAPDFFFHPQVYRADGETITLPPGEYSVEYSRGPEYLVQSTEFAVAHDPQKQTFNLKRWVDPAKLGWWSGDHHIHAAGCAHYTNPTEGVFAADMIRQTTGEDLKIGANLTWGPCFDFQKQFFTGKDDAVSTDLYKLRYDIEVSGFGSHQSGHLVLLRLKEGNYPGGPSDAHWPTLGLSTLKWAKKQGAVTGPAHSGSGLDVRIPPDSKEVLPNYIIPPYNGIGGNEYIVDITHQVPGPDGTPVPAIDFISTVDTNYLSELNMWYHTLNMGFRVRASGETDFPCITGERVGLGRSYVKLEKLNYDAWCEGVQKGRCYVSEGKSHLMDFTVGGVAVGENGSELKLAQPGSVKVTVKVAAYLNETPIDTPNDRRGFGSWKIERARIQGTRKVPVELIVNAQPVARQEIEADGTTRDITFDNVNIPRSSWVAIRILASSHTNPVFVIVDNKPIRASKRSVQWAIDGVEQCWKSKMRTYRPQEMEEAKAAYDHAREVYRKLLGEMEVE